MQINELIIYSSKVKEQADFYATVLNLKIIRSADDHVSIQIGKSILTIAYRAETTPYHFAINIPTHKDIEALDWLKARVDILKDGEHEIQDFDFWNAKAIYFYDQDKNIVELIARNNLNNSSTEVFATNQFLELSEIGVPTSDIEKDFNQLNQLTGVEQFSGAFERFLSVGDEHGLFICINKSLKDWFPTNDKAFSSAFEIELVENGETYRLAYKDEGFSLLV